MRLAKCIAALLLTGWTLNVSNASADSARWHLRRAHAAAALHDGILLCHANSSLEMTGDGFRQDAFFYYLTGLENTVGAVLAIEGKSGESWLFLPSQPPYAKRGLRPETSPGSDSAKKLGIEHVVDWAELEAFLGLRATEGATPYYADDLSRFEDLPPSLLNSKAPKAPTWLQIIAQRWPNYQVKDGSEQVQAIMEVQDSGEIADLRLAAKATVGALIAGMRAIRPAVSQRSVEAVVENTCWSSGARGTSFWPWAMAGENAVFPRPFFASTRYDHLNRRMKAGELVRLDVGCEWDHYQGDLGRTVPVSGHYDEGQRETWTIFVAAYRAGARAFRAEVTVDQIFEAWRNELVSHRSAAKTQLAQHAIEAWSDRKNVPFCRCTPRI